MAVSRRQFIGTAAVSSLAVACGPMPQGLAGERPGALETLTFGSYQRHVGTTFRVTNDAGVAAVLKLTSVEDLRTAAQKRDPAQGDMFIATFQAVGAAELPQDTYRTEHPVLGDGPLFVVPTAPAQDGAARFVVTFNRHAA